MIIDMHTHIFPEEVASKVIHKLGIHVARIAPFTDATHSALCSSMKEAGIAYSVVLPVATNVTQVEKLNRLAIEATESGIQDGIIHFGGMHPDYEDYKTQIRQLAANGVRGIKLHPAYQGVDFDDLRFMRILDAASEAGLSVSVHSGIDIGIYDHNYCSVSHILHVLEEVKPEKLILAHMGNWGHWDDVEEHLCGAPVWFDTSFSLGKIYPNPESTEPPIASYKLTAEAFTRIVRKHGTDHILFGTDCPWGGQKIEVDLIDALNLTEEEKEQIFYKNAVDLLAIDALK